MKSYYKFFKCPSYNFDYRNYRTACQNDLFISLLQQGDNKYSTGLQFYEASRSRIQTGTF